MHPSACVCKCEDPWGKSVLQWTVDHCRRCSRSLSPLQPTACPWQCGTASSLTKPQLGSCTATFCASTSLLHYSFCTHGSVSHKVTIREEQHIITDHPVYVYITHKMGSIRWMLQVLYYTTTTTQCKLQNVQVCTLASKSMPGWQRKTPPPEQVAVSDVCTLVNALVDVRITPPAQVAGDAGSTRARSGEGFVPLCKLQLVAASCSY